MANHLRNAMTAWKGERRRRIQGSRRAITHVRLNYLPIDNRNTTTQPVPAKKGTLESCRCRIIKFLKTPLRIPSRESIHSLNISDTKNAPWPSRTDATEGNPLRPTKYIFFFFFLFRERAREQFRQPSVETLI